MQKHIFTEEEIKYIKDNWGKISIDKLKDIIGCRRETIIKLAQEYELTIPKSNKWTEDEINKLKELSKKYHYIKIASKLERSEKAVYNKAKELGITLIQDRRSWTKEEEILLSDIWGHVKIEIIAKKLKRTPKSIIEKATLLRLGPMIKNNYEFLTVNEIAQLLNVSSSKIKRYWTKLGLKLIPKNVTNNKFYYVVKLNDFIEFLKNNQNEWDSRNLEKNILGYEEKWLEEKRKSDYLENPVFLKKWTEEEKNYAINLFKINKSYKEIALRLNRSEESIKSFLYSKGYRYKSNKLWTEEEIEYLKLNYNKLTKEEISKRIGRTTVAIATKAQELGIKERVNKPWTEEEIEYLRLNYNKLTKEEISTKLGRTIVAIEKKAQKLGIKERVNKPWTEEEIEYLKNIENMNYKELSKVLNKTTSAIQTKVYTLKYKEK